MLVADNQPVPYEREWSQIYKAFRAKRLSIEQMQVCVRFGAFYAQQARSWPGWSPSKRRQTVDRIQKQYERMLRGTAQGLADSSLRQPYKDWLGGYFLHKVFRYAEAYPFFENAENALGADPFFLLDYGRLAYNTGEFVLADRLFHRAHEFQQEIPEELEPLQTLRWLAKLDRVLAQHENEARRLEELKAATSGGFLGLGRRYAKDDRAKSETLWRRRMARAYLDANRPSDAYKHVKAEIKRAGEDQLILALQGVEALVTLDRVDAAARFADKWTDRLKNPAPYTRFLRLADRPYSARRTFLRRARDASDAKDRTDEAKTTLFLNPKTGQVEAATDVPALRPLLAYANQAFRDGLAEEGAELAFDAADRAFEADAPRMVAVVLQDLHKVRAALGDARRVDELFAEAARRFPDAPFVQLQFGLHLLEVAPPEEALDQLRRVEELIGSTNDETYRVYLGIALAGTGSRKAALAQFDKAFGGTDIQSAPFAFGRAIQWAIEEHEYDLALAWADRYLAGEGDAAWTVVESRPILQSAGRAALATGQTERAAEFFDRLLVNYAHHITEDQELPDPHALREYARPLALAAFADALAGNVESARDRLALARHFDLDYDAIPAAAAALALRDGDPAAAAEVLDSDTPPGWLLRALGPPVLEAAEAVGVAPDRLAALRLRVDRAAGTIPSLDDLLVRSRQQARTLAEARAQAEAERQAHLALQASVDDLIADVVAENDRLQAVADERRQAVIDAENQLAIALAEAESRAEGRADGSTDSETESGALIREAFPNITFASGTLESVLALRGASQKSVLRTLGIAQHAPHNLNVREKTVDLGSRGTAYEIAYPGNGNDPGRLYLTGGGTAWTLSRVGYKSTQKRDIAALKNS